MKERKIRIGFVPSFRKFDNVPAHVVKTRQEAIDILSKNENFDLIFPHIKTEKNGQEKTNPVSTPDGCVSNLDHAEIIADYFLNERIDGIIVGALNFGDERSAVKIIEKLSLPTMLYATKEPEVPNDASMARASDSYCGTLSIAAGLHRRSLPFYFAGIFSHQDSEFLKAIDTFIRCVQIIRNLTNSRIGQIGVRPNPFETVAFDEIELARKFHINVIYDEISTIVSEAKQYNDDDPDVQQIIKETKQQVSEISIADDWFYKSAKLEKALTNFWQSNQLSAMSIQCWPEINKLWNMSVCATFGRLTGKGFLTACESDTIGAISMLINFQGSLGKKIPHFIDWTIQHRDDPNKLLAWHCGNASICLANDEKLTALRSRLDMKGIKPINENDMFAGLYQFQVKPGPVTFCRLSEIGGEWKMLIASGEAISSNEIHNGTWSWVKVKDHNRLYHTLIENGFIHHASMIHEDQKEVLKLTCKLMNIEPVVVE